MTTYPIKVPAISVTQQLGSFYVVSLPARVLLDTAYSDRLKAIKSADGNSYELEGAQRELLTPRLREIGAYISTEESTFPNSIILAPNFEMESGEPLNDPAIRWRVDAHESADVSGGVAYTLTIPTAAAVAPIIDGQHRLFGFKFCDDLDRLDTELVCSIFIDLPKPFQAFLFATINANQKPVSKSQTYELFGYNVEKEAPDSWSPDKLAVSLARKLNVEKDSPLQGRILVAAENDFALTRARASHLSTWMISMATVVEGIAKLISQNAKRDRTALLKQPSSRRLRSTLGSETTVDKSPLRALYLESNDKLVYAAVKNFLIAANEVFWSKCSPKSYICKTVGVQALFDVLFELAKEGYNTKTFSVNFFLDRLKAAGDIDFSKDNFKNASGSGRLLIKHCLFVRLGLESKKMKELEPEKKDEIMKAIS